MPPGRRDSRLAHRGSFAFTAALRRLRFLNGLCRALRRQSLVDTSELAGTPGGLSREAVPPLVPADEPAPVVTAVACPRPGSTTTRVPTLTRECRSVMSSLVSRMQPEETKVPMVDG